MTLELAHTRRGYEVDLNLRSSVGQLVSCFVAEHLRANGESSSGTIGSFGEIDLGTRDLQFGSVRCDKCPSAGFFCGIRFGILGVLNKECGSRLKGCRGVWNIAAGSECWRCLEGQEEKRR